MQLVRQNIVKRLIAAVIDAVILGIVGVVVGLVLAKMPYVKGVVAAAVGVAYMTLEIVRAQTVGKMILKLKITAADGLPATQPMLIKRYLCKNVASLVLLAGAISGLSIVTMLASLAGLAVLVSCLLVLRPDRLAGHDILAGTAVYGPASMEFALPPGIAPQHA